MSRIAAGEEVFTRYLIYETPDGGATLNLRGEQNSRNGDQALRQFFGEAHANQDGDYLAISENAAKIRHVKAEVKTTVGEAKTVEGRSDNGAPDGTPPKSVGEAVAASDRLAEEQLPV